MATGSGERPLKPRVLGSRGPLSVSHPFRVLRVAGYFGFARANDDERGGARLWMWTSDFLRSIFVLSELQTSYLCEKEHEVNPIYINYTSTEYDFHMEKHLFYQHQSEDSIDPVALCIGWSSPESNMFETPPSVKYHRHFCKRLPRSENLSKCYVTSMIVSAQRSCQFTDIEKVEDQIARIGVEIIFLFDR